MISYQDAIRYTRTVAKSWRVDYYEDIVHDAWISHYLKYGEDLFSRHQGYVFKALKWMINYDRQGRSYLIGKERFNYTFHDLAALKYTFNQITPHDILVADELRVNVYNKVGKYQPVYGVKGPTLIRTIELLEEGYDGKEIAAMLNTSPQNISNYRKKISQLCGIH